MTINTMNMASSLSLFWQTAAHINVRMTLACIQAREVCALPTAKSLLTTVLIVNSQR